VVDVRPEMLVEAVESIRRLWDGGYVNHHGEYYDVESAKLLDRPEPAPPLGIAVSGQESCSLAGATADFMVSTEPKAELVQMFGAAGGQGKPVVGQIAVCWGGDEATCRTMAHQQFSWSLGG
jgi:G6PDH family F420-dependent oxidoreductase